MLKRFFEYIGLSAIILFSFYYTEKAALLVQSKNPIMLTIKEVEKEELVSPVNAHIVDDTIIPGIYGSTINVDKSFLKMKDFGTFNKYYLVFDKIKPDISLEDNKDKIIIKGHKSKKSVSLVVENNQNISNYLVSHNIKANMLITEENYNTKLERINNESTTKTFENIESILNKDKDNKNICLINNKNRDTCLKNKKYLVKPTHILSANNYVDIKNTIESGSIILIQETARLDDLNLLIKQINYQDLNIVYLSKLINEKD